MKLIAFTGIATVLGVSRLVEFTGDEVVISPLDDEDPRTQITTEEATRLVDFLEGKQVSALSIAAAPLPDEPPQEVAPPKVEPAPAPAKPVEQAPAAAAKAAPAKPKTGKEPARTTKAVAAAAPASAPTEAPKSDTIPAPAPVAEDDIPFGGPEAAPAPATTAPPPAVKTEPTSAPVGGDRDGDYLASDVEVATEIIEAGTLRGILTILKARGFETPDQLVSECEKLKATGKVPVLNRINEVLDARVRRAIELMKESE